MGFLLQWLVYLAAFVAGSAVAAGIVCLLIKPYRPESESESESESGPAASGVAESPTPEVAATELAQPQWPNAEPEPEPEPVEPAAEPEVGESEAVEYGPETDLTRPHWPGSPSQWPGIGVKR